MKMNMKNVIVIQENSPGKFGVHAPVSGACVTYLFIHCVRELSARFDYTENNIFAVIIAPVYSVYLVMHIMTLSVI